MLTAPLPLNEAERLQFLYQEELLDTLPEKSFDSLTRLASEILQVPIALVSLVDKERQWFKSCVGLEVRETHRDFAFCAHAILDDEVLVVEDARTDERFLDSPLVQGEPQIRFYAGVPIKGGGELNLGTFCVIGREPKKLSEKELERLKDLASLVDDSLALRRTLRNQRKNRDSLVHAEKMASIGLLASGVAHEINTPMQFVATNTTFIQSGFQEIQDFLEKVQSLPVVPSPAGALLRDDIRVKEMAEDADLAYLLREVPMAISQNQEGIRRVTEVVAAMRDFSHEHQGVKIAEQLNEAVSSTVVLSRNSRKHTAEVKLDLAPDLPLVECNRGEINQVILNLLINAADAIADRIQMGMEGVGLIQIRSFQRDASVVLEVEDNGAGINPRVRPNIFDPFFTTKPFGKGTGQGLTICYDIVVHKHGGKIEVASPVGKRRTVFRVVLPIKAAVHEDAHSDQA